MNESDMIIELLIKKCYIKKVDLEEVVRSDEPDSNLKKLGIDVVYFFYISRQNAYVFKKTYTALAQGKKLLANLNDGKKVELCSYFYKFDVRTGYTFGIGIKNLSTTKNKG